MARYHRIADLCVSFLSLAAYEDQERVNTLVQDGGKRRQAVMPVARLAGEDLGLVTDHVPVVQTTYGVRNFREPLKATELALW